MVAFTAGPYCTRYYNGTQNAPDPDKLAELQRLNKMIIDDATPYDYLIKPDQAMDCTVEDQQRAAGRSGNLLDGMHPNPDGYALVAQQVHAMFSQIASERVDHRSKN